VGEDFLLITALVVLPSSGDLRRLRGGEVGPDEVGDVDEDPDDRYETVPAAGLTARDCNGDGRWLEVERPWICC